MNLYHHQVKAIEWLRQRPKALVALDAGLGKTAIAIIDLVAPALVIAPSSLKLNWDRELKMWRPELTVQVIRSPKDTPNGSDVTIINYDILRKVSLPGVETLIVDESHAIKNWKAQRTKAVMALIKKTNRVRLLSATPVINRPCELWTSVYAVGAVKMGYHEWGLRYCAGWFTPWNTYDFSGSSNQESLRKLLDPVMLRMTKEQCLSLPEKTYKIVELDLPVATREKAFLAKHIDRPDEIPFEAISDIRRMNAERKLPDAIKYIFDVLESVEKVVIFAHHTHIIGMLMDALKAYGPVSLTGATKLDDRQAAVDTFQTDPACRVFIGNIQAAGTGITLTVASHVIFLEAPWSPSLLHQASDRCHRIGQRNAVMIDILVISASIDCLILHKILAKTSVIDQIIVEKPNLNAKIAAKIREISCIIETGRVLQHPACI